MNVNPLRLTLSLITGLAAALIAYSAFFVRGDLGGVMAYLRARAAARRLSESGADAAQVQAAHQHLRQLGEQVGDPVFATQMIPLALLLGLVVAGLVWQFFRHKGVEEARPDVQERMVYRLAHRKGGRFTLRDLSESSPLTEAQAQVVLARMQELGRLTRQGDEYHLT